MERKRVEPIVLRGVGPDLPEKYYLLRKNGLRNFLAEFNPDDVKSKEELLEIIKRQANRIASIIRAVGSIDKQSGSLNGMRWEAYTPTIETRTLSAGLFTDYGIVRVTIPGQNGFGSKGRPNGGFELILPSESENGGWREQSFQLMQLNNDGNVVGQYRIDDLLDDRVGLFSEKYRKAVAAIVDFAEKNETR